MCENCAVDCVPRKQRALSVAAHEFCNVGADKRDRRLLRSEGLVEPNDPVNDFARYSHLLAGEGDDGDGDGGSDEVDFVLESVAYGHSCLYRSAMGDLARRPPALMRFCRRSFSRCGSRSLGLGLRLELPVDWPVASMAAARPLFCSM